MPERVDVALVFPPIRSWDEPRNFPTGLGILASVLRNEGYSVAVIDAKGESLLVEEVQSALKALRPRIVGIGGIVTTYRFVRSLTRFIKAWDPSIKIMVGGSVGGSIADLMLRKNPVDAVTIGEADETVKDLVPALLEGADLEAVAGIVFRDGDDVVWTKPRELITDLDSLPLPAWDLFPMENYLANPVVGYGRDMDIISSRGCPYHCTYCYQIFGRGFRGRSPENIIAEISELVDRYAVDFISFQDDCFVIKKSRAYEFCDRLDESGLDIKWSCTGRANLADEDLYRRMKAAGCVSISFGIESGSQEILDRYKKGVTVEKAKEAVRIARKVGIKNPTSFMLGAPGETRETAMETVRFCKDVNIPLQALMFTTPYPGTAIHEEVKALGLIPDEEAFIMRLGDCVDFTINLTDMPDAELLALRDEMLALAKADYRPPSTGSTDRLDRELYGERLYEKRRLQLATAAMQAHRQTHGFNE
ncbi:MAG: radical SAM protein [Planctomycetes bacterium]|nr:radical SAM protein [Planctomycetota bacterium]